MRPIPAPPDGSDTAFITAVNSNGDVLVTSEGPSDSASPCSPYNAYVYHITSGTYTRIRPLNDYPDYVMPYALTEDGTGLAQSFGDTDPDTCDPQDATYVTWQNGIATESPYDPGSEGFIIANSGHALNNAGIVAGSIAVEDPESLLYFEHMASFDMNIGPVTHLGGTCGGADGQEYGQGIAVNAAGQMIGRTDFCQADLPDFGLLYSPGSGLANLGTHYRLAAINDQGQVAGTVEGDDSTPDAMLVRGADGTILFSGGLLDANQAAYDTAAADMNNQGHVDGRRLDARGDRGD
jgi:hypothetical protein